MKSTPEKKEAKVCWLVEKNFANPQDWKTGKVVFCAECRAQKD